MKNYKSVSIAHTPQQALEVLKQELAKVLKIGEPILSLVMNFNKEFQEVKITILTTGGAE